MLINTRLVKHFLACVFTSLLFVFVPVIYAQQIDSFTLVNATNGQALAVYANNGGVATGTVSLKI